MDRLSIGLKAGFAEALTARIMREVSDAMARGKDGVPALFEVEFTATDNETGEQVVLVFNNDDMERDDVGGHALIVEVD